MLKTLRTKTRKVMLATLILVIPSFVFFYGWSAIDTRQRRAEQGTAFAKYSFKDDGKLGIDKWKEWRELATEDVLEGQSALQNRTSQLLGAERVATLVREYGKDTLFPASQATVEALNNIALLQEAERNGVTVSDEQVRQAMGVYFARLGVPRDMWQEALRRQGLTPQMLASRIRMQQRLDMAARAVEVQPRASLFELWQIYKMQNESLRISYVTFPLSKFRADVAVDDESLKAWFNENAEDFRMPAKRQYRYAALNKQDLRDQVEVSEQELKDYYEANREEYRRDREVQVRHILLPIDTTEEMTAAQVEAATSATLERAESLLSEIKAGRPFEQVADEASVDPQNVNDTGEKLGGLLQTWISRQNTWVYGNTFSQEALNLQPGQISEPIVVRDGGRFQGVSVLKAEAVKDERIAGFEEVRVEVRREVERDAVDALFNEKRRELDERATDYSSLETMARELGLDDGVTSWVEVNSPYICSEIGYASSDDMEYIQGLRPNEISLPLVTTSKIYFLRILKEVPSRIPGFDEVRDEVEAAYRDEQGRELMKDAAADFLAGLSDNETTDTLKAKAEPLDLEVAGAAPFTRLEQPTTLPGGGLLDFETATLYSKQGDSGMSAAGPSEQAATAWVVWHIAEMREPDRGEFRESIPELRRNILAGERMSLLQEWLWDQRNYEMQVEYSEDL